MRFHFECAVGCARRRNFSTRTGQPRHHPDFARSWAADAASADGLHLKETVMAVIRDVMPAFELLQPDSIAEAQSLLQRNGSDAWVLAGGLDSFDWLKDR